MQLPFKIYLGGAALISSDVFYVNARHVIYCDAGSWLVGHNLKMAQMIMNRNEYTSQMKTEKEHCCD